MSSNQLFALVVCLLIIGSGFRLVYNQILATRWGQQSASWPTVKGHITRARVQRHYGSLSGSSYYPSIGYAYRLDRQFAAVRFRRGGDLDSDQLFSIV